MKTNNIDIIDLSQSELEETNGGVIIALAGLFLASFAIGYQIGRDVKETQEK